MCARMYMFCVAPSSGHRRRLPGSCPTASAGSSVLCMQPRCGRCLRRRDELQGRRRPEARPGLTPSSTAATAAAMPHKTYSCTASASHPATPRTLKELAPGTACGRAVPEGTSEATAARSVRMGVAAHSSCVAPSRWQHAYIHCQGCVAAVHMAERGRQLPLRQPIWSLGARPPGYRHFSFYHR